MEEARNAIQRIRSLFGTPSMNSLIDGDPGYDAIFRTERMKEIRKGKMDQPTLNEWNTLHQRANEISESILAGEKWIAETRHKITHFPRMFTPIQLEMHGKRIKEVERIIEGKQKEVVELEIRMTEAVRHYLEAQYGGKLTLTKDDQIIVLSTKRITACPYPVWLPDGISLAMRAVACGAGLDATEFFRDPAAFMKKHLVLDKVCTVIGKREENFQSNETGRRRRTEKTEGELFGEGLKKKSTEFEGLKNS